MILSDIDNLIWNFCDETSKIILDLVYPNKFDLGKVDSYNLCYYAILNGHLEVLIWAKNNNYKLDPYTYVWAAEKGHLHILKWAKDNDLVFNSDLCAFSARGGHLETLKWLIENNY